MAFNYLSGEPITELEEGRPLFLRSPDSAVNLATSLRAHLFSSIATLRIGMDVLQKGEGVRLDRMFAQGGLFKTEGVAQRLLAAAIDTPVSVGDVAAESGAWGIAVLAAFVAGRKPEQSLADFLNTQVFADSSLETNLTRRTPPVSTPSFSDTSPRCPCNERLSSTADNTAGDLGLVEWCSRLLTEAPLIRCRGSTLLGPDRHPSDAL